MRPGKHFMKTVRHSSSGADSPTGETDNNENIGIAVNSMVIVPVIDPE